MFRIEQSNDHRPTFCYHSGHCAATHTSVPARGLPGSFSLAKTTTCIVGGGKGSSYAENLVYTLELGSATLSRSGPVRLRRSVMTSDNRRVGSTRSCQNAVTFFARYLYIRTSLYRIHNERLRSSIRDPQTPWWLRVRIAGATQHP